jgi:peptide/nickel transport system substrate-binding protein
MSPARGIPAIAAVVLGLAGCGWNSSSEADKPNNGGHLVVAEQFAPEAAWALETNDAFILAAAGCLESLVRYEPQSEPTPALATEWEQVQPTAWDFTLRDDVSFQDGTPLDAEAVATALDHVLNVSAPPRSFNPDVISDVEAVDGSTVRITTPEPDALLPLRLASPNTGILAAKAYAGRQIDIFETCTGPFTVVDEVRRQSVTLERNDTYWGPPASLASAEIRFIADGAARATQVQVGEVDLALYLPASQVATLEQGESVKLKSLAMPRTTAMLLNNSRPPFDDPLVRQAVQRAIDVNAIAESIYEGVVEPAVGPFSPDYPWAPEGATPVAQDLDEAKRLLDEAGVEPGTLSIELIAYNDRPEFASLATIIQDQLKAIGIEVKIETGEYASFEPDFLDGNFDAALFSRSYLIDLADPAGYLASDYGCDGGYNIVQYCNEEVDALIQQAPQAEDPAERHETYAQIADQLQRDAVSVYLVHETMISGVNQRVEGYQIHPIYRDFVLF